jgi:hypothetical protein
VDVNELAEAPRIERREAGQIESHANGSGSHEPDDQGLQVEDFDFAGTNRPAAGQIDDRQRSPSATRDVQSVLHLH